MCEKEFVHLHVHSEYSLLDGLSRISHLANRAKELNQPALALTDHGTMFGTIPFYRACKEVGVKPIIGVETYMASRKMSDKDPQLDRDRFHLLLLAQNKTGYQNLLKIASSSQLDGYYYKPRIDHDFLATHSEGLIATTGCLAAEVPRALNRGQTEHAHKLMEYYMDVFGRERFFIELQSHDIPELVSVNKQLLEFGKRYNLNFVATNDVHYTTAEEANAHDVLLCIQTGSTVQTKDRMRMSDGGYYLKSYDEMASLFGHIPGALENSLLIAEMCDVNLDMTGYHMPLFDVPPGHDATTYMAHLCEKGLIWRYGAERAANDPILRARLNHEINIINRMGFETYFLIVWDLCEFARRVDIWWNVRGSGAGSVVAYTLGITGIDPLANGLIFERFLNPGRVSMPDIDLDYPDDRRHEMVAYTMERYGAEKVAQIITFGTMGARAAIRDVGRALDMPLPEVDGIAKLIPAVPGKPIKIDNVLEEGHEFYSKEFEQRYKSSDDVKELIDNARNLEGVSRHASSHAAGVIVADKPLVEYVPLHRPTSGEAGLGGVDRVTQWPMEVVESIGLLKVDFLGLSTLTVMRTAAKLIKKRYGIEYKMDTIPYDEGHVGPDPTKQPEALFDMLGRGDVAGVFQVEGAGMRRLMMEMKPRRFDHIIAAISLYRPGPMENIPSYIERMHSAIAGTDIVEYHHEDLKPILEDTYGILVYQEQIIRIASDLAGYEPGEADMIRKAVAKKKQKLMDEHRIKFTDGAMARGYSRDVCDAIWGDIEFFARYGFNKAHAADYAVITCQTAFLKAHYPVEYMTALLSVERDKTEKVTKYLAECRRMNIEVAPPSINTAEIDFIIEDTAEVSIIRYGLAAIKNAGVSALEPLIKEREENGRFANLNEFCERVDLRSVGKRTLESMIKVGVFDEWGVRPQLLDALERMVSYSSSIQQANDAGQMSLFGALGSVSELPKMHVDFLRSVDNLSDPYNKLTPRELLDWEKELIGVYLSEHPLEKALTQLGNLNTTKTSEIDSNSNGKQVAIAGMITSVRHHTTKKGDPMAFGVLEDLDGKIDLLFFPRTWAECREQISVNQIIILRGKLQVKEDGKTLMVDSAQINIEIASASTPERAARLPLPTEEPLFPQTKKGTNGRHNPSPPSTESGDHLTNSPPPPPNFEITDPLLQQSTAAHTPPTNGSNDEEPLIGKTVYIQIGQGGSWENSFRQAVQTATQYDGPDQFILTLSGHDQEIHFPNHNTLICDELLSSLQQISQVMTVQIISSSDAKNGSNSHP